MEKASPVIDDFSYEKVRKFITENYGIKLESNKRTLVESRLSNRVRTLGFNSYHDYIVHVFQKKNNQELRVLVDLITTNKTDFFREPPHFNYLTNTIIPELKNKFGYDDTLKIWSSACSSGEEVYTLAMVLEDYASKAGLNYRLFGSDLSSRMLNAAQKAVYPLSRCYPIPDSFKRKYMLKSKDPKLSLAKIKPNIRKKAKFFQHNLMDEEYGNERYHVIFCRNVLIYFDKENQQKVINRLAKVLLPGGYLILGHSESLLGMEVNVQQVRPTIYRKAK